MGLDCPFIKDRSIAHFNITSFSASLPGFIDASNKYKEYFFIIDNTDFPLFNDSPQVSIPTRLDVLVNASFKTSYTITEEYTAYLFIGGAIFFALLLVLGVLIFLYKKHKKLYASAAN
jgi:hypothetical protein